MKLTLRTPDDFHRHMRQGPLLKLLAKHIGPFGRILPMPNTDPPISTGAQAIEYANEISLACNGLVTPVPCIKLMRGTNPDTIHSAAQLGVKAVKFYPKDMTTNSEDGICCEELPDFSHVFSAMEEKGLLLLLHGEHNKAGYCLNREQLFLEEAMKLCVRHRTLKIVLEHITTQAAADLVRALSKKYPIAATITPHHLRITLNDVIGDKLEPHNFCKPVAKSPRDRDALIHAATSGHPSFFLGTDDAPHLNQNKECAHGCAGVWTGPFALGHYAEVFDQMDSLDKLQNFASKFGAEFYGLPLNEGTVELVKDPFVIPHEIDGITPFMAGKTLNWQVR